MANAGQAKNQGLSKWLPVLELTLKPPLIFTHTCHRGSTFLFLFFFWNNSNEKKKQPTSF
jgi:hypothetical protein